MAKKSIIVNADFNPTIARSIIRKHGYKALILSGIIFFAAFIYLRYTKASYGSKAVLQIVRENKVNQVLSNPGQIAPSENLSKDVELMRSSVLFEAAIRKLQLNTSVYSEGKLLTQNLYGYTPFSIIVYNLKDSSLCNTRINLKALSKKEIELSYILGNRKVSKRGPINGMITTDHFKIAINTNEPESFEKTIKENKIYFIFNDPVQICKDLKSGLLISAVDENAKTIEVSYQHENPKLCYQIISNVIATYFDYERINKQNESNQTISFIEGQLDSLALTLDESKDSLSQFQRNQKLSNPTLEEGSLSSNIGALQVSLSQISDEISTVNYVNSKLASEASRIEIYKLVPDMVGHKSFEGAIMRQIEGLNTLLERKEELAQDVTFENNQMRLINERISNRTSTIRKSLAATLDRLNHEKRIIEKQLNLVEVKYYGLPEKTMELNRLKYLEELNRRYYNLFTEKKIEYQLTNAGYSSESRLLSMPELPISPLSPQRGKIYLFATIASLLFSFLLLLLYYLTYNEIINLEALKELLPENTTVLGSIPEYKKKMLYSQVVVNENSKSKISESLRHIKSNMNFINKNAKIIAVSSSISGEGKTFVAINLASVIAISGKKTLVIDLDLRKPKVHLAFNSENDKGMSQVLSKMLSLDTIIKKSSIDSLYYIPAGPIPPNPSDLVQGEYFNAILDELKNEFDVIIIDNPPIGIVSDGIQILANSDIPIYVFKANYSKRVFAEQLTNLFSIQKIKKINVILNSVSNQENLYGYGYGYAGYGNSNNGYYTDDAKSKSIWSRLKFWKR